MSNKCFIFFVAVHVTTGRPLIGIYPTLTYLRPYEEWVKREGADSVVLPKDFADDQVEDLFQSINGFLIPGASKSSSTRAVKAMVQRAVRANTEEGDYFPIWGTCIGFEWLVKIFGNTTLDHFDAENLRLPLNFSEVAPSSRTYAGASSSLVSWFAKEAITLNYHNWGITPEHFASNSGLASQFKVLATNLDRRGKVFVSHFEGATLPIYGTQFHPEKVEYYKARLHSTGHAIAGARYLGQFFVSEAMKNNHRRSIVVFM